MNAPIDISNVTLKTDRLLLRPWRQEDLDDLYTYASVDGVGQMAGWKPHESKEESQAILDRFIKKKKTFALEYEGKVIGSLGIEEYDEEQFPEFRDKRCREIGYVLSKAYWGRGLMPEAVREVIRFLFDETKLDVIFCGHFLRNRQSARVQEKCGFRHYTFGTYRTQIGTVEDHETNILTREADRGLREGRNKVKEIDILGANRFETFTKTRPGSRAVTVKDGMILLSHETVTGWWLIPGGGMEEGETPEECCVREVEEETGLIVKPLRQFLTLNEYYEEYRYISHYFVCEVTGRGQMRLTDAEKKRGLEPKWLPLREAFELFSRHQSYAEVSEEQRGSYLREYTALREYLEAEA